MLQIESWQLITGIATIIVAFGSMIWLFGTVLVKQFKGQLDQRFEAIESARKSAGESLRGELQQLKNVERDFLKFQADLPMRFVLRDDYVRGQSVLEAKQDALFSKMELVRMEIAQVKGVSK